MDDRERRNEEVRWMQLAKGRVQWRTLELAVLHLRIQLSQR
jgi:hypothetical protein